MKGKKIDYLRLIIVQFNILPIADKFQISELDVYNMLSTRYMNKYAKYDFLRILRSEDLYSTSIAEDLFQLGATKLKSTPESFFYINAEYTHLGLPEKYPRSEAGKSYNQVLEEVFNA